MFIIRVINIMKQPKNSIKSDKFLKINYKIHFHAHIPDKQFCIYGTYRVCPVYLRILIVRNRFKARIADRPMAERRYVTRYDIHGKRFCQPTY